MMKIEEITKLPPRELLKIMEQIWDSLAREEELPESPAWHEELLAARKQRLENGEARLLTINELKKMKAT
jgi:putative addiction module component (TIGR02574 family)